MINTGARIRRNIEDAVQKVVRQELYECPEPFLYLLSLPMEGKNRSRIRKLAKDTAGYYFCHSDADPLTVGELIEDLCSHRRPYPNLAFVNATTPTAMATRAGAA